MVPSIYKPHPILREFVENIVIVTIDFTKLDYISPLYTYVPTHTRFLCFYLHDPVKVKKEDGDYSTRPRAIIIGPHLKPVQLDLGQKHSCVYVALKPFAMFRLLGIPQDEMVGLDFDGQLLLGKDVDDVLSQLSEASTDLEKNVIIQQYMLSKLGSLKASLPFDMAIMELLKAGGNLPVEQVASLSCLSLRQFERKCLERLGLSPKIYSRMVRFTNAYKFKERYPNATWTSIAHYCGYFDQMHLIRDFKFFAGFNPGFLKEKDFETSVRFQILGDES